MHGEIAEVPKPRREDRGIGADGGDPRRQVRESRTRAWTTSHGGTDFSGARCIGAGIGGIFRLPP